MSPPPESAPSARHEFTPEERKILLQLAHDSIAAALDNRKIPLDPPSPHLAEPRGPSPPFISVDSCTAASDSFSPQLRSIAPSQKPRGLRHSRTHAFRPSPPKKLPN